MERKVSHLVGDPAWAGLLIALMVLNSRGARTRARPGRDGWGSRDG